MNIQEGNLLNAIRKEGFTNQRKLAEQTGYSLGTVNASIKALIQNGFLSAEKKLTDKALKVIKDSKPKNAVILAAGYGMRMIPINSEVPKGLLEVDGEPLIERIIQQLHQVGIVDIDIVSGFMKEKYEYLIDKYNVRLLYNNKYSLKNNLHSLYKVREKISNTYVIPCDIWCEENPFSEEELYSWYMVTDKEIEESSVRISKSQELIRVRSSEKGNEMIGIAYLLSDRAEELVSRMDVMVREKEYDHSFWEDALYCENRMKIYARIKKSETVSEINTYEELRELDASSRQLKSSTVKGIAEILNVDEHEISEVTVLKKGMTNRSFLFSSRGKRYIMRMPGEGTELLINRRQEAEVYQKIKGQEICDNVLYISPDSGCKITEYIENTRVCDPENINDLKMCMQFLKKIHQKGIKVEHEFDIWKYINFYESLWKEAESVFPDYQDTKKKVFELKQYIESLNIEKVLTHIDAVPDNFLITGNEASEDNIRLIDWEYAGMQDPHVDIAMFCIYAMYDRDHVEQLIDIYFEGKCTGEERRKIYCYIAACGLLWSNWCEYKRMLGVEFGEYSLRQYRYAKEYYKIFSREYCK